MIKYLLHVHGDRPDRHPSFDDIRDAIIEETGAELIFSAAEASGLTLVLGACLNPMYLLQSENRSNLIIYNFEQVVEDSPWMNKGYINLLRATHVWDYSQQNVKELSRLYGINHAKLCPVTYSKAFEFKKHDFPIKYDALFYGSMNERRGKMLDSLVEKGINVGFFGTAKKDERDHAIQSSRLVLNYSYYPSKVFAVLRVCHLAANGKLVISEISNDEWGNDYYKDIAVVCDESTYVDTVADYLVKDNEELNLLGKQAKEALLRLPSFKENINNALNKLGL